MEKLLEVLKQKVEELSEKNKDYNLTEDFLEHLYSVYPFNKFEFVISHLIATQTINLQQYLDLRNDYLKRNKFLYVFEITAPRTFGENWAQRHLNEVVPELERPSTKLDPTYSGEYDFWLEGIKIEVKASRAVKRQTGESLIMKALSSTSNFGFDMNFQQIKTRCCDVFVWIGVWRDTIRYWVLSSDEVKENPYYSAGQHRGNKGEGQLWIKESNIQDFKKYEVNVHDLLSKIKEKAGK